MRRDPHSGRAFSVPASGPFRKSFDCSYADCHAVDRADRHRSGIQQEKIADRLQPVGLKVELKVAEMLPDSRPRPTAVSAAEMIQRTSNDATAYHNRAVAYGLAGDIDSAIADYTKVIEMARRTL